MKVTQMAVRKVVCRRNRRGDRAVLPIVLCSAQPFRQPLAGLWRNQPIAQPRMSRSGRTRAPGVVGARVSVAAAPRRHGQGPHTPNISRADGSATVIGQHREVGGAGVGRRLRIIRIAPSSRGAHIYDAVRHAEAKRRVRGLRKHRRLRELGIGRALAPSIGNIRSFWFHQQIVIFVH